MKISGLATPVLILDVNILKRNQEKMNTLLKNTSLKLRPHYKSHKCASIAKWQIANGAIGMTCAKLSEAEDLCDAGIEDILIANQVVELQKIHRMADLARNCKLTVCVDDKKNIQDISAAAVASDSMIHCYVEYDIGMERCGVSEKEEVLELVRWIAEHEHLAFEGIQAYAGHISHVEREDERRKMTRENYAKLQELISYLKDNGVTVKNISGGSTGTAQIKAMEGLYTELQAGSYLFMDSTYRELDLLFQNSLFLLTTVVSQRQHLTVVDAGVKTCGVDQGMPVPCGVSVKKIVASEEHFQLHGFTGTETIGDKLKLIPSHCCSTVNLHDKIYVVDGDKVIERIPVTARGIGR